MFSLVGALAATRVFSGTVPGLTWSVTLAPLATLLRSVSPVDVLVMYPPPCISTLLTVSPAIVRYGPVALPAEMLS